MNFTMPTPASKQTVWILLATGSVVLAGVVAGGLMKYRDRFWTPSLPAPASTPGTAYEVWTKTDLYERAKEKDIAGRSGMNKEELVQALRAA